MYVKRLHQNGGLHTDAAECHVTEHRTQFHTVKMQKEEIDHGKSFI